MILRTVQMHFRPDTVSAFLELFEAHRNTICEEHGCQSLQLIQSQAHPERIGTISIWKNQKDLDAYRNSTLFGTVWPATKALFASKAHAESHRILWSS